MPTATLLPSLLFLLLAGFSIVGRYLTSHWDLPFQLAFDITGPWALYSFLATAIAASLLRRGHLRMGYVLVALAGAGPAASLIHVLIDFSQAEPFAPDF